MRSVTKPVIGTTSSRAMQFLSPTYGLTFLLLFSFFFSFLQKLCYPYYLGRAPLHQLVVDFPFEYQNIFTKENIGNKNGTAV
jgi:hypothetical protein